MEINISCSSFSIHMLSDVIWEGMKGSSLVLLLPFPLPCSHPSSGARLAAFGESPASPGAAEQQITSVHLALYNLEIMEMRTT